MAYFKDAQEVHKYVGGVFRKARETEAGPKMAKADLDMQVYYSDPDATLTVRMHGDNIEVEDGGDDPKADVKLFMPSDIADKYWRGEYNFAVGLAKVAAFITMVLLILCLVAGLVAGSPYREIALRALILALVASGVFFLIANGLLNAIVVVRHLRGTLATTSRVHRRD